MFIEYSQEAIDNSSPEVVIQSLLSASSAMREGKHIVCTCNPDLARQIVDFSINKENSVARTFNKLRESFSQIASVKKIVCVYIQICAGNTLSGQEENGVQVIHIGIEQTLCSDFWHETLLILENFRDEISYKILQNACNIYKIGTKWDVLSGGGTTTADFIEKNIKLKKILLCVVDGDVRCPHGDIGETAFKVVEKAKGYLLGRIITTNCIEVENLFFDYAILYRFGYEKNKKNQRIFSCLDKALCLAKDIFLYYDVKKGYRYKDIKDNEYLKKAFAMSIDICEKRRSDEICKNCDSCLSIVVEDMGKNYLAQLLEKDNAEYELVSLYSSLSTFLQQEWQRIAKELISWCCACQINPYQI